MDATIIGRTYPPAPPYKVTAEAVSAFVASTGGTYAGPDEPAPPTFPIVAAFPAMMAFLNHEGLDLSRIVHGEQRFSFTRPVRVGDQLSATVSVATLRQIGGNDIIGTSSEITDADGALVCTGTATLVHRGA